MKTSTVTVTKCLLMLLILMTGVAHADTVVPNTSMCSLATSGSGVLDLILNQYYSATTTWQSIMLPAATKLFWGLFSLEFLYQLTFKKILTMDIQKLWVFFVVRIFTAYMFAHIFLDPSFYLGIVSYFIKLGSQAGGFTVNITSGNPFAGMSPSGLMNVGDCVVNQVFAEMNNLTGLGGVVSAVIYSLPFFIMSVFIYILAAFMALALFLTALEAYVVLFGGFILCGFSGSSWTQGYWQKYLGYVGGVAIRLLVTCLILGVIKSSTTALFASVMGMQGADLSVFLGTLMLVLINTLINAVLVLTIPSKAASMLNGSVNASLGDVIGAASAIMGGAIGGAAVLGAAKTMAGGLAGAPGAGRTAAIGKARELLGGGAGGGSASSKPSDWKSQAQAAGTQASQQHVKDAWTKAKGNLSTGSSKLTGAASKAANMSSAHGGAADINVNAHRE